MTSIQVAPTGQAGRPGVPHSPQEIAADAAQCVAAGASAFHLHAFDDEGRESLGAEPVGRVLRAVRARCPHVGINFTTFAEIEPDPRRRLQLVREWTELPDFVAANQGEAGVDAISELMAGRGVGIEACLLSTRDAERFVCSASAVDFVRVVVEPLQTDPAAALATAAEIEGVLTSAGVTLPQLHHGVGAASWHVIRRAVARGHDIRVGLEDLDTLPDGRTARSNAELVAAAVELIRSGTRS